MRLNYIVRRICRIFISTDFPIPHKLRMYLLKRLGYSIESQSCVLAGCKFWVSDFHLGERSFINKYWVFSGYGTKNEGSQIIIGKDVMVGFNVVFCANGHLIGTKEHRAGNHICKPIIVEDGCWIGANVIILGGCTIRKGCIIAAGSVVTRDCEEDGLYTGNPAIRKKDLGK